MKISPKMAVLGVVYLALILGMAWYSRHKAIDFAREESARQEQLGQGYTPGFRLSAMNEIFDRDPSDANLEEQATLAAAGAAMELTSSLVSRLQAAMEEGGPVAAVNVCGEVAQELTQKLATEQGISMRRVALRHRNPQNAPDAYETAWLESQAATTAEQPSAAFGEIVPAADGGPGEYRYLSPIYLKAQCLVCHGSAEQIPADVQAVLAERYPDDRATDFSLGELRGAISIRVPFADEVSGGR